MGTLPDPDWILVDFEGEGSGTSPLSWGQLYTWDTVTRTGEALCVGGPFELPEGITVEAIAWIVRTAMSRHEVLRTLLHRRADGTMEQEVHSRGRVAIEVIDAGDLDPYEIVGEIYEFYANLNFDYAVEWPVRFGVVHRDGALTHLVVAYAHMAVDGAGLNALQRDMATRDQAPPPPARGLTPRAQALRQQSSAARNQNENALRAWEAMLHRMPARLFQPLPQAQPVRYWEATFESPAMYRAAALLAERNGLSTSPVMVATFAVALAELAHLGTVPFQVMVSNRFRPGFADAVAPTSQSGLCVVDVDGLTFDEIVQQADSVAVRTHLCAYYDPLALDALIDRISRERGDELDLSCFFNDRRFETPRDVQEVPSPAEVLAVVGESRLTWGVQMDRFNEKLFVHVNDVAGATQLFACADTFYISPAQFETLLRRMESILVDAACTPRRDHTLAAS